MQKIKGVLEINWNYKNTIQGNIKRVLNMVDAENVAGIITGIMKESIEDTGSVVCCGCKAMRSTAEKGKHILHCRF